ncbi:MULTISPECIES: PPE family protein [Mycobacterium]|jgi:PPE-repeat protein|uniref:PPE family protein n=4 Tax=Mycobacterium kiyosense TaxID=2871094 RepID=A0AA37PY21_9MYCO|nr:MULTISPECIES: PPE family protein [Mycobacterium]BDE17169.1 PPE family protein [Mycobacterium sp. 20KCMC460]GLB86350.1 PPE family protein [Mycobacterium kiyosense]GLB92443.1 PPE family protein [Mycobacterium kiyosense]GLC04695.1 PPE family protein [Mycobacterium kiyosense]GLC11112.1 PPE family protein [Mycobacterium kiyosense]
MTGYEVPPEINSGRMYAGPGSSSLVASAAAWQALAVELGSAGAAFGSVVSALAAGSWLGPSSISMALAAAPYVVWMIATAQQCEEAAAAAGAAAAAFEGARAGVVPPPVIEANRNTLMTLMATNFLGVNTPAIAATEAAYDEMWGQDSTVMYGFAADAAGITGTLVPFLPPLPNSNPMGLAAQAAALGQAGGTAAGQQPFNLASQSSGLTSLPAGIDAQTMLTMGPQLVTMIPSALQGLSSPLSSGLGSPAGGLGQFQSLLSPFMGMLNNPGLMGMGTGGAGAAGGLTGSGLSGLSGGASAGGGVEAIAGRAASLGGLSVPATWTAGGPSESGTTAARAAAPVVAPPGAATGAAVPASASGAGMYGGAPMAAGLGGRGSDGAGTPRYGTPVKVFDRH